MESFFYHRRDTPGHVPMTSSSQWSGYIRSRLTELTVSESFDELAEETEPENLTEQLRAATRERRTAHLAEKLEILSDGKKSPGYLRKDTPAFINEAKQKLKGSFTLDVTASFLPVTISESFDELAEETEPEKLTEQLRAANRERRTAHLAEKLETILSDGKKSPGYLRKDTPAFIQDAKQKLKGSFNLDVTASFIPEDDNEVEEKNHHKEKSSGKQQKNDNFTAAASGILLSPRRRICVGPTDAPSVGSSIVLSALLTGLSL